MRQTKISKIYIPALRQSKSCFKIGSSFFIFNLQYISVLGSTGSIGTQTLDIVRTFPDKFKIVGLSTNTNLELLQKQIKEFQPLAVAVMDLEKAEELKKENPNCEVYGGMDGLIKIAQLKKTEIVVTAVVGEIGIEPTLAGIEAGKTIALANKETLVSAGEKVMNLAKKKNVEIRPIDSEHSAIWQCLQSGKRNEVKKVWLTASGGPFWDADKWSLEKLKTVTKAEVLNHPNWQMGAKISVDSATMMNKGLELIEAMHLFDLKPEEIEIVIHPQSLVHSAVEFVDGNIIAQISKPDMRHAILYALTYPERQANNFAPLNLFDQKFEFFKPDFERYPCLKLALECAKKGGDFPKKLNRANEEAVGKFLKGEIGFLEIGEYIKKQLI